LDDSPEPFFQPDDLLDSTSPPLLSQAYRYFSPSLRSRVVGDIGTCCGGALPRADLYPSVPDGRIKFRILSSDAPFFRSPPPRGTLFYFRAVPFSMSAIDTVDQKFPRLPKPPMCLFSEGYSFFLTCPVFISSPQLSFPSRKAPCTGPRLEFFRTTLPFPPPPLLTFSIIRSEQSFDPPASFC